MGDRTKICLLFHTTTFTYFSDTVSDSESFCIAWTSCRTKLALLLPYSPWAPRFSFSHIHSAMGAPWWSVIQATPPLVWLWFQWHRLRVEKSSLSIALTTGLIWGWGCDLSQSNPSDFWKFPEDSGAVTRTLWVIQAVDVVLWEFFRTTSTKTTHGRGLKWKTRWKETFEPWRNQARSLWTFQMWKPIQFHIVKAS